MNCKRQLALLVVLVLAAATRLCADDIDEFVKAQLPVRHIPGAAIAVVKDGKLVKAEGYGMANLEFNIPVRTDTVFKIGSTSKQFFAAGVMILVQDGKIKVEDKVSKYFPGAPAAWQSITIRHLLTHTSGLVREAPGFDPWKAQTDLDVIKTAYSVPLRFAPGDNYEYSNLGYYMLAEIIHQVSGKPWTEFLHDRIFAPLGMNSTRETSLYDVIANRAGGYAWNVDKFANMENWITVRPSGAFLSTVLDLAKWEIALQSDRVLTAASKKEMWTPVVLNNGNTSPYGYGWQLEDFPVGVPPTGVAQIRHGGTIPGFRSQFARWPKYNLAVIVLTNLEDAALDLIYSGIGVRVVPELMPAFVKRWPQ
jgi:CubicO group peptidase (beta-lactamase class C family)